MKKIVFLLLCLLAAACSREQEPGQLHPPLPIMGGWIKLDVDEGYNFDTYVLPMEHGWLIYRNGSFSGGMAFVPLPESRQ